MELVVGINGNTNRIEIEKNTKSGWLCRVFVSPMRLFIAEAETESEVDVVEKSI